MKAIIVGLMAAASLMGGCSFAARSPDMYRDAVGSALTPKNDEIKACYDGVLKTTPGAAGKVTVNFQVDTDKGALTNVTVDKANTTAPDAVATCVTNAITGVTITPPDARLGKGTWAYDFSAPAGAAPAAVTPAPAAASPVSTPVKT
ncbi:MAG TPA: AgmX/PglI C-terminal domain-containing protein [Polyangiaceae bacterium]